MENEKDVKSEPEESVQDESKQSEKDKSTTETPRDGRGKQKEFFKEELKRLKTNLDREKSKIKPPTQKEHTPYIFNSLEPYYNVHTAKYLIELCDDAPHGYETRRTATGLIDPWVDWEMDNKFLPKVEGKTQPATSPRENKDQKKKSNDKERPPKEGSTRLPKFPAVSVPTGELAKKPLTYSDVPMLRQELKKKYSAEAQSKVDQDYARTKQDFYRMELDRMEEIHPSSRSNMRSAYFAYLQNSPGSRKAVYECVRATEPNANKQQPKKTAAAAK